MKIGDVVDSFDQSDDLGKAQKEVVESLAALGSAKVDLFEKEIEEYIRTAGDGNNLSIPVSGIISSFKEVRAYSSNEADNIGTVVKDLLSVFLKRTKEDVIDSVGNLMADSLSMFLGEATAATGTTEQYYIAAEGISMVRLDIKSWYQNVTAESIRSKMERVTAVVAVKSVVDLSKIDFSLFLNLYSSQLSDGDIKAKGLDEAIKEAKVIYKEFQDLKIDDNINYSFVTKGPNR